MSTYSSIGSGHGARGHRTWLHLLPEDRALVAGPEQLGATAELLVEFGLATLGSGAEILLPGPTFARLLGTPGQLPMAGPVRGEVRLEAGVLRCYPDPGPQGFDTNPSRSYRADCPECGGAMEFFLLRFPDPDPMRAACPSCAARFDISVLGWSPPLPVARTELTFGDLDGRPSLRESEFFGRLQGLWRTSLTEVHVTL
ncbi:MAG TPA: zinc ribbon domain-containing protein [Candidatus Micrarchaeaceae archaeon]|nr:zinc ribbon domain-containing protein [Candidatus Micrarchaeaceae archaeon]